MKNSYKKKKYVYFQTFFYEHLEQWRIYIHTFRTRNPLFSSLFSSFLCSFKKNLNMPPSTPLGLVPLSGKYWIRHCVGFENSVAGFQRVHWFVVGCFSVPFLENFGQWPSHFAWMRTSRLHSADEHLFVSYLHSQSVDVNQIFSSR